MRRAIMLFLAFGGCVAVHAAPPQDPLQRLFTSASQRAELDRRRSQGILEEVATVEQGQNVELNGYIVRGDGNNVVWLNGKSSINKDGTSADIRVDSKGISQQRVPVYLPEGKVSLKPGQVYARGSGTVTESYLVKGASALSGESAADQPAGGDANE